MKDLGLSSHILTLLIYIFLIFKLISFKKLNKAGQVSRGRKIFKPVLFIFDFLFLLFIFYFFIFSFFIILKLIYLIKNKNIMNYYKLFIKNILIIIIIYIKI